MQHIVQIKKGPHSTDIPKGMGCLLAEFFNSAGLRMEDQIIVHLGEQIRASEHCQRIEVKRLDPRRKSVVIAVKPGDNGTRFNCFVFRPKGYVKTEKDFFDLLKGAEAKFNAREEEEKKKRKEDVGVVEMNNTKGEMGNVCAAPEAPIPAEAPLTSARRMVAAILDEETIKIVLMEIQSAEGGKILQSQLKKNIVSLGIKCSELQAVRFLEKEGYIVNVGFTSRIKIYFSLGHKGSRLLGLQKEKQVTEEATSQSAPLDVSVQKPAQTSDDVSKMAEKSSELVSLSKQFEEAEQRVLASEEVIKAINKQLEQALEAQKDLEEKKLEIKQKIINLLK